MNQDKPKIYKVLYKHNQLSFKKTVFIPLDYSSENVEQRLKDQLFYSIHRYMELPNGDENGERSHGTFSFEYCEVNRLDDERLNDLITGCLDEIDYAKLRLQSFNTQKNEPFIQLTDIIKVS